MTRRRPNRLWRSARLVGAGVLVLAVSAGLASGSAQAPANPKIQVCVAGKSGALRLKKRKRCRRGERLITWHLRGLRGPAGPAGVRGAAGPEGAQGPQGATGATGPQGQAGSNGLPGDDGADGARGPAVFLARANSVSTGTLFAAAVGITTATGTEGDVQTLSPNAGMTAKDLSVRATIPVLVASSVAVTLRDDGADTAVTCTIPALGTTCNSAASSASIGAGSAVSLEITSTGVVAGLSLLIGWQAA